MRLLYGNKEANVVKLSSGKNWLKSADLKTGNLLGIVNEGEWTESSKFTNSDGSPVRQFVIRVSLNAEQRDITLNKISRTNLSDAWGEETAKWVGKTARVEKVKVMVSGEMKDSVVLFASDVEPDGVSEDESSEAPF